MRFRQLLAVTLMVLLSGVATVADPAHAQECGDVSGGEGITATDALLLLQKSVGLNTPPLVCPFPATGQTTSYGAGDDGDLRPGTPLRYVDNGDGTITDLNTELMWEKKIALTGVLTPCASEAGTCANPHHADNGYTWGDAASEQPYDGSVVAILLNQLNNRCDENSTVSCTANTDCAMPGGVCGFAGYRDWRLPNFKELHSIVDAERVGPATDPVFDSSSCGPACIDIRDPACSCTASPFYWSSTTYALNPGRTWVVYFNVGNVYDISKLNYTFARAVRGGV